MLGLLVVVWSCFVRLWVWVAMPLMRESRFSRVRSAVRMVWALPERVRRVWLGFMVWPSVTWGWVFRFRAWVSVVVSWMPAMVPFSLAMICAVVVRLGGIRVVAVMSPWPMSSVRNLRSFCSKMCWGINMGFMWLFGFKILLGGVGG